MSTKRNSYNNWLLKDDKSIPYSTFRRHKNSVQNSKYEKETRKKNSNIKEQSSKNLSEEDKLTNEICIDSIDQTEFLNDYQNIEKYDYVTSKEKGELCNEDEDVSENSILEPSYIVIKIFVTNGVFDKPARAAILNVVQYNGKFGCSKCYQPGLNIKTVKNGTVHVYPFQNYQYNKPLRSHEKYMSDVNKAILQNKSFRGIKGPSQLNRLKYYFPIESTVIDFMHSILEGVVKNLIMYWFDYKFREEKFSLRFYLNFVNKILLNLRVPKFIPRIPRSIDELLNWKANEIEINGISKARWNGETLSAEILYIGSRLKCEKILDDICDENFKRNKIMKECSEENTSKKLKLFKQRSQPEDNKNVSKIQITSLKSISSNTSEKNEKQNLEPLFSQIEERNSLISNLETENLKLQSECQNLREKLVLSQTLSDLDFIEKITEIGLQIVRHLATDSQKEELKKFSLNTGQINLHSSYPTVNVSQIQYDKFLFVINTKKSAKSIFKSIIITFISDWKIWSSQNAESIRKTYPTYLNAVR
ncbi:hypothetical protein BpHYR1_014813, partial [Brachionus plicatilis]